MKRPLVLASLALTLAIAPALAGDTKDGLGWKFTKGEKVRYAYIYNLEMKLDAMGMAYNVHQNARLELTEETKDVADGVASVEATLDRIQIDVELPAMLGGGGKIAFDSDKKADDKDKKDDKKKDDDDDDDAPKGGGRMGRLGNLGKDPLGGLRDVIGMKFTFKIARDGSISALDGVDAISKKATAKLGAAGGMAGGGGGAGFPLLDPEVLQQTLDLHCHVFPSGDAGESWQIPTSIQVPSIGTMEFKRTITPKGEDKLVQTSGKCELKPMKGGAAGPMAALGKPKIKDPSFDGTSKFSRDKGKITGDELTASLTSELSVDNPMGGGKKKKGGDDDDDDDAPKKDEKKKDDDKKKDGDDEEEGGKGGGMKVKVVQKFKLVLKYELLTGDKKADEPKSDEK